MRHSVNDKSTLIYRNDRRASSKAVAASTIQAQDKWLEGYGFKLTHCMFVRRELRLFS